MYVIILRQTPYLDFEKRFEYSIGLQALSENRRIYTQSQYTLSSCMAKKCERCGTPALDDRSEFCNGCGSPVKEEPVLKVLVCSRCKSPAPNAEVLFCNRCGTEYPIAEPENNSLLCPRCGNNIHDDQSEFCNRCGASVTQAPEQKVPVCSKCGNPAPDDESLFCNRCGTAYKKQPVNTTPVCLRCGYTIPDVQSLFCNRCGATVGTKPVNQKPVCSKCGAKALDDKTLFCNRCGTQFNPQVSNKKSVHSTVHKQVQPVSVKISQKKQVPAVVVPSDLWDPVPDEEFEEVHYPHTISPPASTSQKKYAHLPLVADELAGGKVKDASIVISGNSKKYAHLPLIADEFKEKQSPRLEIESPYIPAPPKEKRAGRSKKGLFDLLNK